MRGKRHDEIVQLHKRESPHEASPPPQLRLILYLPAIDTAAMTLTPSNNATMIMATSARIPDLEVEIPAGTTITLTEPDGTTTTVNEITLTAVPIDRAPMPLPEGFDVPLLLTLQPTRRNVSLLST